MSHKFNRIDVLDKKITGEIIEKTLVLNIVETDNGYNYSYGNETVIMAKPEDFELKNLLKLNVPLNEVHIHNNKFDNELKSKIEEKSEYFLSKLNINKQE